MRIDHVGVMPFLDALLPLRVSESYSFHGKAIYRGVWDFDKHQLIPSSLRDDTIFAISSMYRDKKAIPKLGPNAMPSAELSGGYGPVKAELQMLMNYYNILQKQGASTFVDDYSFRAKFIENTYWQATDDGSTTWPPVELYDLMALARHSGLPTRLLDWSRSPYIAAYFAARGVFYEVVQLLAAEKRGFIGSRYLKEKIKDAVSKTLAVWITGEMNTKLATRKQVRPITITPSFRANPYMRAQQGLFTSVSRPWSLETLDEEYLPLDKVANNEPAGSPANVVPSFRVHTLPCRLAPSLIEALSGHGIDEAALFPGEVGSARQVTQDSELKAVRAAIAEHCGPD
jgi:hypothetical protein